MRNLLLSLFSAALAFASSACSDASGNLLGGELSDGGNAEFSDVIEVAPDTGPAVPMCPTMIANTVPLPDAGTEHWSAIYPCYFQECGTASMCHAVAGDPGASVSGFVCGLTAASCATGLTQSFGGYQPLVPAGGSSTPASANLFSHLRLEHPIPGGFNSMPLIPGDFKFSDQDVAIIEAWIQGGAKNN